MRRAAVSNGENNPVAALGHSLINRGDRERLSTIADNDIEQFGTTTADSIQNRLHDAHGMHRACRNDHERLLWSLSGVVENKLDEFCELFATGAVAAREGESRQQGAEPREGRVGHQRFTSLVINGLRQVSRRIANRSLERRR